MKRVFSLTLAAALLLALLSACGSNCTCNCNCAYVPNSDSGQDKRVDLAAFAQTLQENHEFPTLERNDPADELGAVMLDNYYPGLKDMDLEQVEVYMAAVSFNGGELALVQAKNSADASKVKEIFDARVAAKTTEGPSNYPAEVEAWQHNSAVASNGCYVMLVNHEDSADIVSEFNALFS